MINYTARASRRKDPSGPYFVQVAGVRDDGVEWPNVPDPVTVRSWLAGILARPEGAFGLRLDFDYGDAPS